MDYFQDYFQELKKHPLKDITEYSKRSALENLLNSIINEISPKVKLLHEPKRQGEHGSPDFMISINDSIIGYIENKGIKENLDDYANSEQIKKYQKLTSNIILTNYIEFRWLKHDETVTLCSHNEVENKNFKLSNDKKEQLVELLSHFIAQKPEPISDIRTLAISLSERAKYLFRIIADELSNQSDNEVNRDDIWQTYQDFSTTIYQELTTDLFADTFAQTLTYSLFIAKINSNDNEKIDLLNVSTKIPNSFELVQKLTKPIRILQDEPEKYAKANWIIEELLSIINNVDTDAIYNGLNFKNFKTQNKDPYIYFYETFLKEYNPELRKNRGVYYTPYEAVNFMIGCIDCILKDTFKISKGIADNEKVTILDIAAGTGSFMYEIIKRLNEFKRFDKPDGSNLVKNHILKNIFGFELLIAPYTIAHLKLSEFLKQSGYTLTGSERLGIYLTNTIENKEPSHVNYLTGLNKESELSYSTKLKKILVITGNPPYSGKSSNISSFIGKETKTYKSGKKRDVKVKIDTFIGQLIKDYYKIDNQYIDETNSKWLQNDYVKFIRYSQWKIDNTGEGLIVLITSNSFLDGLSFRGMRKSLMDSFNLIYIFDLHGNSNKREKMSDGGADENIFDIQEGVCISILIKKKGLDKKIYKSDLMGKSKVKLNYLLESEFDNIDWYEIVPDAPNYLFVKTDNTNKELYETGISVNDIFISKNVGIVTARDKLTIRNSASEVKHIIDDFSSLPPEEAREKYSIKADVRDWQVSLAQKDIISTNKSEENIKPILYRPFDVRYTYYTGHSKGFLCMPRPEIMKNMLQDNIALITVRQVAEENFSHVLVSDLLVDFRTTLSYRGGSYLYPLFLYKELKSHGESEQLQIGFSGKSENFTKSFREFLNTKYQHTFSAYEIMGYIYAILHSNIYRKMFNEFLKTDFPKILFCEDAIDFYELSSLGNALISVHLQRSSPENDIAENFDGKIDNYSVTDIKFQIVDNIGRVYINSENWFENIPENIWNHEIGGYRPIHKYLSSREKKDLSFEEIEQVKKIAKLIHFTINQSMLIDKIVSKFIN